MVVNRYHRIVSRLRSLPGAAAAGSSDVTSPAVAEGRGAARERPAEKSSVAACRCEICSAVSSGRKRRNPMSLVSSCNAQSSVPSIDLVVVCRSHGCNQVVGIVVQVEHVLGAVVQVEHALRAFVLE